MFDFLFDRKTQSQTVKHILIALTIFSAAQHIVDYQLYRTEWHQYYEIKLKRKGLDENIAENLSKIMFIARIIGTLLYNIIFISYIVVNQVLLKAFRRTPTLIMAITGFTLVIIDRHQQSFGFFHTNYLINF